MKTTKTILCYSNQHTEPKAADFAIDNGDMLIHLCKQHKDDYVGWLRTWEFDYKVTSIRNARSKA